MLVVRQNGEHLARRRSWRVLVLGIVTFTMLFGGEWRSGNVHAATRAVSWPIVRLQLIASGFDKPVGLVSPRDGTDRLFVLESGGKVFVIENGVRLATPFLDLSGSVATCHECGLLGLAFPSGFAEKGYFFVNYTSEADIVGPDTGDDDASDIGDTVIARINVSGNPNVADASSETPILTINQPAANHNGGQILFGPDGYLYIGMGDGGGGGDTYQNAQDPQSLHGKILRIEVGATGTYTVPDSNPFVDTPNYRDEIWAMGLRNPWRFSVDPATGDFWIGDVGQSAYEEINHVAAEDVAAGGMNFGWPVVEGNSCYPPDEVTNCNRTGFTAPVSVYYHDEGCSVTGGYFFDSQLPNQARIYLYGDYCTGNVWGVQPEGNRWVTTRLTQSRIMITSFGDDAEGNVYIVGESGSIYRVTDPDNFNYLPGLVKND